MEAIGVIEGGIDSMQVFALYGTSGTGKSSTALRLAHQMQIDAIIDDGILIFEGRKVAGTSAKYENTKIQAVKRAIFHYPEHSHTVIETIKHLPIQRLLILGTSLRMIERIVDALNLPPVEEYIPIEAVKPLEEIQAAQYVRETQGKHVIPIPRVEVEKDFLHRLISSAQKILSPKRELIGETTVVHPTFSGGRIQIYEQVLKKIVQFACCRNPEVLQVHKTVYTFEDLPRFTISLSLRLPFGSPIQPVIRQLQRELYEEATYCLNIAPASIDIQINSLQLTKGTIA